MKAEGSTTGAGGIGATSPEAAGASLPPASQPQAGAAAQVGAAAPQVGAAAPQVGAAYPQLGAAAAQLLQLLPQPLLQHLWWQEKIRSSRQQLFLQQLLQPLLQPEVQEVGAAQPQLGAAAPQLLPQPLPQPLLQQR